MTTLAEAVDGVFRDLADESKQVFSPTQVEDFVRGGIAELNRIAPNDTTYDIPLEVDVDGVVSVFGYEVPVELPYRVEVLRESDGYTFDVTEQADDYWVGTGGMNFRRTPTGGHIDFPRWWLTTLDPGVWTIRLHGYALRPLPYQVDPDPSPELGLSGEELYSVRAYAKSEGFDLLSHDRALFAQWQGQTNNTDVSPTQMMQMAGGAKSDWQRHRNTVRVVRKYW